MACTSWEVVYHSLQPLDKESTIWITISVPKRPFVAEPRDSVSAKIRLHAAAGMYRVGELSIGAACELVGVDRYTFLDFCRRHDIALQTQTNVCHADAGLHPVLAQEIRVFNRA
jgi:hypothetical protein